MVVVGSGGLIDRNWHLNINCTVQDVIIVWFCFALLISLHVFYFLSLSKSKIKHFTVPII